MSSDNIDNDILNTLNKNNNNESNSNNVDKNENKNNNNNDNDLLNVNSTPEDSLKQLFKSINPLECFINCTISYILACCKASNVFILKFIDSLE